MDIRTKSVHSPDSQRDGLRILATRLRGRGLPKNRYHVWMASLGPSEELLRSFQSAQITWPEFARRYRQELFESDAIDRKNGTIKNHGQKFTLRLIQILAQKSPITILCHCAEDERHCHRHVLAKVLSGKI